VTTRAALLAIGALVLVSACGDDGRNRSEPPSTTRQQLRDGYDPGPVRYPTYVVPGSHDCVPPSGDADIAWEDLRNPIYAEQAMTKDMTVRFIDGRWHMWFGTRSRDVMGYATSTDWTDWQLAENPPDSGGSSDITRAVDRRYVLARQVEDAVLVRDGRKVVYRASDDPAELHLSEPRRIAPGVYDDERQIDAALAHTEMGVFAMFKRGERETLVQQPTLVHSPSGYLDGPWSLVGDVESIGLAENFQLLTIDGKWHLLVTSIPYHDPTLFRMEGDPTLPQSWLDWTEVGALDVPAEEWNDGPHESRGVTHDVANSGYLCDARAVDGHFYLFYAGATELRSNDGRGHQKIGVARSTDLATFEVPG
jgi:hypothetical protein